jgi:hypothetical protein
MAEVICPNCNRQVAPDGDFDDLIVNGKCGWCHLEDKRESDAAEWKERLEDESWAGIHGQRIRHERDIRLSRTDWTQLTDQSANTRNLWANYRQALRNIPQAFAKPLEVVWPNPPA